MRVTVIHNISAGDEGHPAADILAELRAVGHDVSYASTRQNWQAAVQDPGDLVVAAGGDGTVAKVARMLIGGAVPLAILPLGTANNVARTLGQRGSWRVQLRALPGWPVRMMDVGVSRGAWGEHIFIEGAGLGLFADAMASDNARGDDLPTGGGTILDRDIVHVRDQLRRAVARRYNIEAGDDAWEDEAILVAIMNARSIGPQLELAAGATPFDGMLDLVVAGEFDRAALDRYLAARMAGRRDELRLHTLTARRIRVVWHEQGSVHCDDARWVGARGHDAAFEIRPGCLPVLVPPP